MFGLSFGHILLFGIIVLVFVGPEQLPEVARNLARFINELRRTTKDFQNQFTGDLNLHQPWDQPLPRPPVHAPAPAPGSLAAESTPLAPHAGDTLDPAEAVASETATNLNLTEAAITPAVDVDVDTGKVNSKEIKKS